MSRRSRAKPPSPFRYFNSSPEVIRLVVMMYVRYPLSLRNVEDLLAERGIDICHETVRMWWNRFGPLFAADVRASGSAACAGTALSDQRGSRAGALLTGGHEPQIPSQTAEPLPLLQLLA